MQQSDPTPEGSTPLVSGETFLFKGLQSTRLNALDPNRMKVLWDRPIAKGSRLLATDDQTVYLGGPEICARSICKAATCCGRPAFRGAARTARVLVRKEASGNRRPAGSSRSTPRPARCGGSSAARTWDPSEAT